MNLEILSDLEQIVASLLSEGKCACHFINPHKTRILMWKEIQKDGTVIYHLRIGIQKFVSSEQQDRNGETYWRYYSFEGKKEPTNLDTTNLRPETTSNHAKSDDEQSINNSATS